MKKKLARYRMDNSATIYPMVVTKTAQSLFGLYAKMQQEVDRDLLLAAINLSFERYPYYKVRIRYGFFRPYFEENPHPYVLWKKRNFPLEPITFPHNNGYPFVTEVDGKYVYMIFFHALCDATGAMEFLKTVLHTYLKLIGKPVESIGVHPFDEKSSEGESEDAFEKYYKKYPLISGAKNMAGGYAFGPTGEYLPENRFESRRVSCKTEDLLRVSRAHGCSVTVFLTALLAMSVFLSHEIPPRRNNYVFFIPVNYRKFFPSETLRNFTGFARCVIPKETEFSVETLISIIGEEMKKQLDKEELHKKLSFSSLMSKNPLMAILPYRLKKRISLWGRGIGKMPRQTMILSNIGRVAFPETDEIDRFGFIVNCNARTPENVGVLSYKDNTEITFLRKIVPDKLERKFFELLSGYLPCSFIQEYSH